MTKKKKIKIKNTLRKNQLGRNKRIENSRGRQVEFVFPAPEGKDVYLQGNLMTGIRRRCPWYKLAQEIGRLKSNYFPAGMSLNPLWTGLGWRMYLAGL